MSRYSVIFLRFSCANKKWRLLTQVSQTSDHDRSISRANSFTGQGESSKCLFFLEQLYFSAALPWGHHYFSLQKMAAKKSTIIVTLPLDLSFWSFLTFWHHGIEDVERHLLWKFHKKVQRKSWLNVPPKLLACIRFLYKVVHKIGRLRKFNCSREIEFNFFYRLDYLYGTWHTCSSYLWLQTLPQIFSFLPRYLVMVFQSRKNGVKSWLNFERP